MIAMMERNEDDIAIKKAWTEAASELYNISHKQVARFPRNGSR